MIDIKVCKTASGNHRPGRTPNGKSHRGVKDNYVVLWLNSPNPKHDLWLNCWCRTFSPCPSNETCDWVESPFETLQTGRWYATNQLLPDGRQIIIGGRSTFTYEFLPANGIPEVQLPFLQATQDAQTDNLYPYVHLLPDGTLYIFANRDSIIYNYITNTVIKTFPTIPGEPRNYPSAGSSVMLPLMASENYGVAEVLVCGGAQFGAFQTPGANLTCSQTCGRMSVWDPNATWAMETMPYPRCMGDMIILPTRQVLIINGAQQGDWLFYLFLQSNHQSNHH